MRYFDEENNDSPYLRIATSGITPVEIDSFTFVNNGKGEPLYSSLVKIADINLENAIIDTISFLGEVKTFCLIKSKTLIIQDYGIIYSEKEQRISAAANYTTIHYSLVKYNGIPVDGSKIFYNILDRY